MKINYQILKRYLEGQEGGLYKHQLISWFNNLVDEKELRDQSQRYWEELPGEDFESYDESRVLGNIYREIKLRENLAKNRPSGTVRMVNFMVKVAAVLFIPLLILYVSENDFRSYSSSEMAYTEIYSPLGARTMFYLPDGSQGWLSGGSYLSFPQKFTGTTRNVSLKGEAYFDVVTNPKNPFVVSGKFIDIVAKGTEFNVTAWEDAPETNVVLVEGKLDIFFEGRGSREQVASLKPGQLLHFVPSRTGSYVDAVDVEKYISWIHGRLVFRDDPFSDVVKRINRWFNVNLVIKDDILKSYKYVATFQDESLDEILKMLTFSAPIRYRELKRTRMEDGTFGKRTIELYYKPLKK